MAPASSSAPTTHSQADGAPGPVPALSDLQRSEVLALADFGIGSLHAIPVGARAGVVSIEVHCDDGARPTRVTVHVGNGRR